MTSIFFFTIITILITTLFLATVEGYGASAKYCKGSLVTEYDVATYSSYVAHVLAELARIAPTNPSLVGAAVFPNDAPGSVQGTATCDGTTDPCRCKSCLSGLRRLLVESCSHYEGGGVKGGEICGMGFGIVQS